MGRIGLDYTTLRLLVITTCMHALSAGACACKAGDDGVHGGVAEDKRPAVGRKDEDGHLSAAEGTELAGLPEKAGSSLGKRDLEGACVLYFLDINLLAAHGAFLLCNSATRIV